MGIQKPSIPKGTRDFSPLEMMRRQYIFDTIRSVFRLYGYAPLETPSMENLSTLLGKYGDEGDKLLFKILNSGDYAAGLSDDEVRSASRICEKGLRYDLTVPFARYVVQHQSELVFPFKRYQIQPVWRADRPQKGRYREFYQCDVDVIGSRSLLHEVELIEIVARVFRALRIGVVLKMNNRKILYGIAETIGHADKMIDITVAIDKLYGIFSKGYMLSDAASVGSDVPVMLRGGYNRLFGTGERFDSFDAPTLYGILLYGDPGVSTKECYALFDRMYEGGAYSPADNDALVAAMKSGDIDGIAAQCKNALFLPACELCPIVGERTAALDSIGAAAAFMTGSGSACFGLFGSEDEAADACKEMKAKFPSLGEAEVVSTVPSGVTENRDTLAAYRKLLGVPPKKPTFDF